MTIDLDNMPEVNGLERQLYFALHSIEPFDPDDEEIILKPFPKGIPEGLKPLKRINYYFSNHGYVRMEYNLSNEKKVTITAVEYDDLQDYMVENNLQAASIQFGLMDHANSGHDHLGLPGYDEDLKRYGMELGMSEDDIARMQNVMMETADNARKAVDRYKGSTKKNQWWEISMYQTVQGMLNIACDSVGNMDLSNVSVIMPFGEDIYAKRGRGIPISYVLSDGFKIRQLKDWYTAAIGWFNAPSTPLPLDLSQSTQ
ncbi:MAG: hypothetical protein ABIH34_01685 [Nanoarchaeota archaeon]